MALRNNPLQRQPENFDLARPTQFRFDILKIPNTQYFATEVNLPGIAFSGDAIMNSRYKAMPFMGDTLDFSPMELSFNVQENLANWREIYNWMTGIGFPKSPQQYSDAIKDATEEKLNANPQKGGVTNPSVLTSDATLTILTGKNNPVIRVLFRNLYPTSLSGLQFDTKDTDSTTLTASVTFNYDLYEIEEL
jgi:hypothetical protein